MFANRNEPLAQCHVVAVTLPALGFKTTNQPIETPREPQVGGARRTLDRAHAPYQHFEVVHPSEEVLRLFQHRDTGHRARTTHLAHQLEPVTQFLDSYADVVQPIRQVQAGGVVDRDAKLYGTPARALLRRREALVVARGSWPRMRLADSRYGSPA